MISENGNCHKKIKTRWCIRVMAESSVFDLLESQERAEKLVSNGPHRGQAVGLECVFVPG